MASAWPLPATQRWRRSSSQTTYSRPLTSWSTRWGGEGGPRAEGGGGGARGGGDGACGEGLQGGGGCRPGRPGRQAGVIQGRCSLPCAPLRSEDQAWACACRTCNCQDNMTRFGVPNTPPHPNPTHTLQAAKYRYRSGGHFHCGGLTVRAPCGEGAAGDRGGIGAEVIAFAGVWDEGVRDLGRGSGGGQRVLTGAAASGRCGNP